MIRLRAVLTLIILSFFASVLSLTANAEERQIICAKYQTRDGWSDSYRVNATLANGYELNNATRSMNYDSISKYVVIFWGEHQASVIKLEYPFLTIFSRGTDQQDREWEVSPAYGPCM
ncbi:hypothetical protein [Burkholderia sp. Bp8990]|uniref:hypothetical protein n=1 Tax=Burkholderia sp. Bp8990 TaxID=2184552 RepID=UPI000F5A79BC|nr:hypothetical protein [Burkholderia sp. Bp8990]RQS39788.1 hypothetical protein DIE01_16385 [Burkholderia sp. Bp8990]